MDKTSTFTIVGLLVVGVAFFLALLLVSRENDKVPADTLESFSDNEWITAPAVHSASGTRDFIITSKTVVTAKHAYRNGMHIIAGEIPLPTPCHLLEARGTASSDKKEIFVEIISSITYGESCAESVTPARFKVSVSAAQKAKINAALNGQEVTLNLIEAGQDDDLDNFELYIKG